jgi:voltage-gated potassium channel
MKISGIRVFLENSIVDDIIIIFLAVFSVGLLIVEASAPLNSGRTHIYDLIDLSIALIFLLEWVYRLVVSKNKKQYAISNSWELLACIPLTGNFAQALRALRILRVIRIIRLAARLKRISEFSKTLSKHAYALEILIVFLAITFVASMLFDTFERGINPHVHSIWDSFWWGMSTATTVAYGDIAPVTTGGRIVALFLALFGLGTLGLLTARIASTFIKDRQT